MLFMVSQLIRKVYIKLFGTNAPQESPRGLALDALRIDDQPVETTEGRTVTTRVSCSSVGTT